VSSERGESRRGLTRYRGGRASVLDGRGLEPESTGPRRGRIERPIEKLLVSALYCILAVLAIAGERSELAGPGLAGVFGLVVALHYLFARHLSRAERAFLDSTRRQAGLLGTVLLVLVCARLLIDAAEPASPWLAFLVPLSVVTLVARIVHGQRFALEVTVYTGFLLALLLYCSPFPEGRMIPLIAVLFTGAFTAAIFTTSIRKRSKLVKVGAVVGAAQMVTLICFQAMFRDFDRLEIVFAGLQGLAAGYLVSGSLPFIELLFRVLTDISLLELCNQNDQPLLKKLLLRAPGTHHHSFIVGILAESAAEAIGANPLLCRAGAYYHDIGKMVKPRYFAENIRSGASPHDSLEPAMSCLIICAHTKDGLEIGRRYGLHESILEFIPTHHGTTLVRYFHHKAQMKQGGEKVSEESFRYPGPRPRTRETGLVNLADAVEASTRSLDDPSPAALRNQVHAIIMQRMMDRQLDETGLSFRDLSRIEDAFVRVLVGIHHGRPKYPSPAGVPLRGSDVARGGPAGEEG
jgi:putative nucleotidyltransferase with HDIG domain